DLILRHPVGERITHWAVAIAFVFLFLSGLAMFHPFFFWLSFLFGEGQFMRFLHPIAGAALVLLFYPYAVQVWKDNRWQPVDSAWVKHMWGFMRKEYHAEDTGKYNAGQKLMFWSMVPIIAALFLTGVVVWQPWFAPAFSPAVRRVAGLLHAICAFIMFIGIGVHWYAAYWTRGAVRAMVRGTVTRPWAQFHHPVWYRKVTGKDA
ncbi:MAG TPA: formate dehydrogenase subunit gamma, partial [Candidatus Methylomirabilis sp.]|nr:formate dehydrogenase subunit gamma [Candidatus Methylomirabilis sp.]